MKVYELGIANATATLKMTIPIDATKIATQYVGTRYYPKSNTDTFWLNSRLTNCTALHFSLSDEVLSMASLVTEKNEQLYNTKYATIDASEILYGQIGYGTDGKIVGTMPNNGVKTYIPGDSDISIPTGYYNNSKILAVDITNLQEYNSCLAISQAILNGNVFPYTKLEYIEAASGQYISTGIPLLNYDTWKIELDYQPTAVNYEYNGVWGLSNSTTVYECWIAKNGATYTRYNGTKPSAITLTTGSFYVF